MSFAWASLGAALIIGLVVLAAGIIAFFVWLFWTVAGIIMDIGGWTKYGWPLQLVIFLVIWSICGGVGVKIR